MRTLATLTLALTLAAPALADDGEPPSTGLSVFVSADAYRAARNAASFYDGSPSSPNTILRILHSETYGTQIWSSLKNAGLITDAIGNYNNLTIAEYPDAIDYRISYQIGLGIRYDYPSRFGWLLRANLAKLQAQGTFNLSTDNGTGILGSTQYIPCGILGKEDRISLDLALTRTFPLSRNLELELDLGASLLNTKVRDNLIEIAGSTYSILDRWNGLSPSSTTGEYDYINQGRIGYGIFTSLLIGYRVSGIGALRLCYTLGHARITFADRQCWGWQHTLGIRAEINNFSFL
ncbi:MAG: hypothetical protein IJU19_00295 [Bacteroidales bacterium]|nr:hypothetical protein [Bacteroidales bacterium]